MNGPPVISRRALLVGFWLAGTSLAGAQVKKRGNDQGIGGTGITGSDQGIGGTGIVGVIQRFGSIYVNGERVAYAPDVPVRIDGEAASAKALRIGQLARVVAQRDAGGTLSTKRIDVTSEVTGPVEQVRPGGLTVLGQTVAWTGRESWLKVGAHVAVFGLRRTDGVVVASLVQERHDAAARVAGPLERDRAGVLRIGELKLAGVDAALVGQRVLAEGHVAQGVMQVSRSRADDFSDLAGANRLLIEAYVRRVGNDLQLGSGFVARDHSRFSPAADTRVVVNARLSGPRELRVESVQSVGKFPGSSVKSPGTPGRGPGGGSGPGHGSGSGSGLGGPGGRGAPGGGGPGGGPGGAPSGMPGSSPPGGGTAPDPLSGGPTGPGPGGFGPPGGPLGPGGGFGGGGPPSGMGGGGRR
ncbi:MULTISPECIES: DUF5666 domain-containing protein [Bradyrhizobium]|uniref:DUF5666 domain-containing protein n=1 Tax=Bradyrhizobium TaxID=374 RepID=UPI00048899E4|nr:MULTISPECIES: DUF5666 domain-containing protein [Bradyrhizobium]MCS3449156.1 hypothetical protein [Bradyrhizobium elkanii]MCS3559701.1 hypothetical protein [Bradyrhizobium elkanii]MCW2150453.1 hypothetical protein [Bradyrhizobium elkanii]MCW2359489.1 hypothetical protein [Bradyrhizobium elkanii]MCW2374184.1 hypothetical protein [Bradyrhizobium elkanii]